MRIIAILFLSLLTFTSYAQKRQKIDQLVVKDTLIFQGGSPAADKVAVSMDGNGSIKWVYLSDITDTINFDSLNVNYINANTVRVNRDSFTDPAASIASIGDSGFIVECAAVCSDIRWTTVDEGQTVLKDSTDLVGIGTSAPTAKLHVDGDVYFNNTDPSKAHLIQYHDAAFDTLVFQQIDATSITLEINSPTYSPSITVNMAGVSIDGGGGVIQLAGIGAANGYVLTSDASGNATWQDHTAYGEMGFGDSTRTIALTQNVFSVVTNSNNTLWSTAAVDLHNVTYSGDSLIIDSAGTYQVNVQLSVEGTNASIIRMGVFINGALACTCTGWQQLSNNQIIQLTYINIDTFNVGDVVQVVVTNTANSDDVDAIAGKITINKIR